MVGEAEHPGFFEAPRRPAAHHYLHGHTFAGHDEAGEDDKVETHDSGPFVARLAAGVALWGLILVLLWML